MQFTNEREFENYIRNLIDENITKENKKIFALTNKKAVDIIVCRNDPSAEIFFIEVKYHIHSHGRLGFGSGTGLGFQPEILLKRPHYFEKNLRWILANEGCDEIYFLTNDVLLNYVSGGEIGKKFNNIQKRLFKEENGLNEKGLIKELKNWLTK